MIEYFDIFWINLIITFLIGLTSTFTYRFLSEYIPNLRRRPRPHIIRNWNPDDLIYILLGGLFTIAMNPIRIDQAMIFGASWDALFIKLMRRG